MDALILRSVTEVPFPDITYILDAWLYSGTGWGQALGSVWLHYMFKADRSTCSAKTFLSARVSFMEASWLEISIVRPVSEGICNMPSFARYSHSLASQLAVDRIACQYNVWWRLRLKPLTLAALYMHMYISCGPLLSMCKHVQCIVLAWCYHNFFLLMEKSRSLSKDPNLVEMSFGRSLPSKQYLQEDNPFDLQFFTQCCYRTTVIEVCPPLQEPSIFLLSRSRPIIPRNCSEICEIP